ncbi:MAG: 4-hydroxythreonine-4-phosphate dehydrogenase PdxA [Opitutales bacterium]
MKKSPPLALTCGDPAGIGPEIIAAWLAAHSDEAANVAVLGPALWLESLPPAARRIPVGPEDYAATPGTPDGAGALTAWAAMERAAAGCVSGEFAGVVTGPVNKERLAAIGFSFPGQTEFFAARWGGEPVMCFAGGRLRVALATWHVPLHAVSKFLGPHQLRRAVAAADALARADGCAAPRIGVCGLNPHAGEGGLLGLEERDFINPTLERLRAEFPGLSLCQPADSLFVRALSHPAEAGRTGEFDVVVALYHDQGLAPLKVVDFDEAVNITLGLPHVRTSPDHGTAFGLAGRGKASPRSFTNAVTLAWRLIGARKT